MQAAVIAEKGLRGSMEDAYYLNTDFHSKGWIFGGVFDGHNGQYAAGYSADRLPTLFLESFLQGLTPQQSFISSYERISVELSSQDSGTTAATVLIKDGMIYSANVGDARAVVIGLETINQITVDHRVDNAEERARVERMGGVIHYPYIYRQGNGIMPSRTIGDEFFKPVGVIAVPSVNECKILPDDQVLLVACDGLFDYMRNEETAVFARRFSLPRKILEELKNEVLFKRNGTDNLTMIAVDLRI